MNDISRDAVARGWLGRIATPLAEAILAAGAWRTYASGEVIYNLGASERALWGIAAGTVRMHVAIVDQPPRFGHVAAPGFWFGELEFLTGLPRVIEMEATGETRVVKVTGQDLERVLARHADGWREIARLAALNEALAVTVADDLLIRDPRPRLAATLLRLASRRGAYQGNPPLIAIPATQAELAEAANLSRTRTAALLAEFVASGAVTTEYRQIRIVDADRLESFAVTWSGR